jgi:hypothetical protein
VHTADGWIRLGLITDLASGVLFLVLGLLLALVRPRRVLSSAFAAFSVFIGVAYLFANLASDYLNVVRDSWPIAVYLVAAACAIPCLIVVATRFPLPLGRDAVRILTPPTIALAVAVLVQLVALALFVGDYGRLPFSGLSPAWFVPGMLIFWGLLDALAFFLVLLAWRLPYLAGPTRPKQRRQAALVSIALMPYVALAASGHTMTTFGGPRPIIFVGYGVIVVLGLLAGALWLRNGATAAPRERRLFHVIGVLAFALPVLGSAFVLWTHDWNKVGILGLARFVGVAVLAYAIARQQLFDTDMRIKWTVNRGSVAATFVSVFFVVEQIVQNWAGDAFGVAAGAVATGLLVLAVHPLQRVAKRFADAAMPHVHEDDPNYTLENKRATYRDALAVAWSDGVLTAKEMLMLSRLRESLRLPDREVLALENEWARLAPSAPIRKPAVSA